MAKPDLTEFEQIDENAELRNALVNAQRQLAKAKRVQDAMVAATLQGAKEAMLAMGPMPPVKPPKKDRRAGKPEVALWHLTDWQGSKVTATYNSDVMDERIMRYCDKAEMLTDLQRSHHPVPGCHIMFGGDLIEGLFNFPQQVFEIDSTLFGQYTNVSRLVIKVVRRALGIYEWVEVIDEDGNHGRLGSKRAVVPRVDNVDRMICHFAREMLLDEKRLRWHEQTDDDVKRVEIGNYRALLFHGNEVGRNGFASPMTILGHVARWQSGAYPWEFRDAYYGHYHNHQEWALPNGKGALYQTGAPESDNRYARDTMAAASSPSQRLHFIDPRKGRVTAQYKVLLDDD